MGILRLAERALRLARFLREIDRQDELVTLNFTENRHRTCSYLGLQRRGSNSLMPLPRRAVRACGHREIARKHVPNWYGLLVTHPVAEVPH